MLKGIIISFVLTIIWIVAHCTSAHFWRPRRKFLSIFVFFTIAAPLVPLAYTLTPPDLFYLSPQYARTPYWFGLVSCLLTYVLFFFAYVEFFYYVERSVTLRLLAEINKSYRPTLDDIRKYYNVESMVIDRVEAMRDNGFIISSNGLWRLTPKGELFARISIFFRRFLNLGPGQ